MGLSGVLAGGTLLAVCGFLSGLMALVLPMWLITRIELHNKLCWTGSGLWTTNFFWGQDIPEMGLVCEGSPQDTYDLYCGADATGYEASMCWPTNVAKVSLIGAQLTGALVVFLAYRVGASKPASSSDYTYEIWLSRGLFFFSILSSALCAAAFTAMYTSQMFSAEHAYEISKDLPAPFSSSQFGCVFQSPLRAKNMIQALIKSSPLNCLYGGPSFAMGATSLVCWFLAGIFYALLGRDVKKLQASIGGEHINRVTPKTPIRHPLLTEILYPRNYSLYGAVSRRYANSSWRKCLVLLVPLFTMATAVHFAIMMLLNGAAVQVFIRLSSPAFSRNQWEPVLKAHPAHRAEFPEQFFKGRDQPQIAQVELIEEVFDFTMLTSIKNFWDGDAWALALLTAVFCAVWPFARVTIHLIMYFIPVPEHERGRTLTWIDSLGKWTYVNTFVLCFMGVAFHLQSQLRFKSLLGPDLLDVDIEVALGPRIGTYMFVIGALASTVLSELYVTLHRKCRDWEEQRNAETLSGRRTHISIAESSTIAEGLLRGASPALLPSVVDDPEPSDIAQAVVRNQSRKIVYQHGFGYEALCDRHLRPVMGHGKFKYSPFGKCLFWLALGLTACTTLAGMLQVSVAFDFDGLVGQVIVNDLARHREYSLVSIGTSIEYDMGSTVLGGIFLTGVFFAIAFVAPLLRLCGLLVLWYVPMRPRQQQFWFHIMEVIESWSALDVYFVSILAATLEISQLSKVILGDSFPAVEELVNKLFPQYGGLFVIHQKLLNGMYLIFVGVALEKLISISIIAQTANAVSERITQEKLALERNRSLPSARESNDVLNELEAHPETWAILSPAARYTSASANTKIVYSGVPRSIWNLGIRLGLMVPAERRDSADDGNGGDEGAASYFTLENV